MKKEVYAIVFVIIFFATYAYLNILGSDTIYLSEEAFCGGKPEQVILFLSAATNAHGEAVGQTNYGTPLCYSEIFGKPYDTLKDPSFRKCKPDTSNLFLRLSSLTNAHAETPQNSNYDVEICYGDLRSCTARQGSCLENEGERAVVRLSSLTNAHLERGSLTNYANVVCCKVQQVAPPIPVQDKACNNGKDDDGDGKIDLADPGCSDAQDDDETDAPLPQGKTYWADASGTRFGAGKAKANVNQKVTLVAMEVPANAKVTFVIWDDDLAFDDQIKTVEVNAIDDEAKYLWSISQGEYNLGGKDEDSPLELYFTAKSSGYDETSDTLYLSATIAPVEEKKGCAVYTEETACTRDVNEQYKKDPQYADAVTGYRTQFGSSFGCNVGPQTDKNGEVTSTRCRCMWKENSCKFTKSFNNIKGTGLDPVRTVLCTATECSYSYTVSDCVGGRQTHNPTRNLVFAESCTPEEKNQIEEDKCPVIESWEDVCGSNRLLVPFFDNMHLLFALISLGGIYFFLLLRKK